MGSNLQGLDLAGMAAFLKEAGLDGADLAVRPGYPVHPGNAATELPRAAKLFAEQGLVIGLVPHHELLHSIAQHLMIPFIDAQKLLKRARWLAHEVGDGLDALAGQVAELAAHIVRQVSSRLRTSKAIMKLVQESHQFRSQRKNLVLCHP
jgi:hypothetical protein